VVDQILTARATAPVVTMMRAEADMAPAGVERVDATIGLAGLLTEEVSVETVGTVRLETAVAPSVLSAAAVTGSDPSDLSATVGVVSGVNGTRAARAGRDHPTALLGATGMGNVVVVRSTVTPATVLTAGAAGRTGHDGPTERDATVRPAVPTRNAGVRATVAPTAIVTDRGRDVATAAEAATEGAASVPSEAVLAMVGATGVRTVLDATGSVREVTVTVSVPRGPAADGTAIAVSVRSVERGTEIGLSVRSEERGTETGRSVRSVAVPVAEVETSAAVIVSRVVMTGAGATMRGVPIDRAMATATAGVGAMTAVGGKSPCGRATDARLGETAMHGRRKRS
jgi:hypothetical protein